MPILVLLLACSPASVNLGAGASDVRSADTDTARDTGAGDTADTAIARDTGAGDTADTAIARDTGAGDTADTGELEDTADTGELEDTADTGELEDTARDTAEACAGVSLSPSDVTLIQDSGATYSVTITGCADPLVVICPAWITVSGAPSSVDGSASITLAPVHGWAVPIDDTCDVGGEALAVHLRG